VAAAAGVSTATVSRALRGLPRVAQPTRIRIFGIANALGYTPSASAAGLIVAMTAATAMNFLSSKPNWKNSSPAPQSGTDPWSFASINTSEDCSTQRVAQQNSGKVLGLPQVLLTLGVDCFQAA
jgi:transcriptional regulator with XRE-family HTH domain